MQVIRIAVKNITKEHIELVTRITALCSTEQTATHNAEEKNSQDINV